MHIYPFRQQAFRIMNSINLVLMLLALALASWHQTWGAALLIGLPALIVPFVLYKTLRDHRLSRIAFGVSFMLFCFFHNQKVVWLPFNPCPDRDVVQTRRPVVIALLNG